MEEIFYTKFKLIAQEFYKGEKVDKNERQFSLIALDKFCLFLTGELQNEESHREEEFFNNIPYKFNIFFLKEVENGSITNQNLQEWRNTLVSFSAWLHKKGYSEFTAIQNDSFALEK